MSEQIIITLISSCITILGFFVTIYTLMRSFKNEMQKTKNNIVLEHIRDLPYEILDNFDHLNDKDYNSKILLNEFTIIMKKVYAYGSIDAIGIISKMQQENYLRKKNEFANKYRPVCFYILLVTQIKYDVTGNAVSPDYWYRMKITDYEQNKFNFIDENNKIVKEMNLNPKFKI